MRPCPPIVIDSIVDEFTQMHGKPHYVTEPARSLVDWIRLDQIIVLSQCNARDILAAFSGKSEQPYIGRLYPAFFCFFLFSFFLCVQLFRVSIPPAYTLMKDGYGVFNVSTNLDACRTHEGWSGTSKSDLLRQGIEACGVFGLEFRRSNH